MVETAEARILIVDDRPENIFAMENILLGSNRSFLHATSGKEALSIMLNEAVDLIILDVKMPGMDGFEVAQVLKAHKRTKEIPIIFASAERQDVSFVMRGYEEGAVDFLFKPIDPQLLRAKVSVLLKIQLQKRELIQKNISLERTALLINNSADIIGVIDPATLMFIEVNKAFTTILGYDAEDIRKYPVTYFLGDDDRLFVRTMNKKQSGELMFVTQVMTKANTQKWFHWKVVVRNGMWFVNARDITDIKEVQRIRIYYTAVVKQSSEAIYIINRQGNVISWNRGAEKIYGYKEAEAFRLNIKAIIPEEYRDQMTAILERVSNGERAEETESGRITKDGINRDVVFSASLIKDPFGDESAIAITERDITQRKIAEEEIRQLNVSLERKVQERTAELSEKKAILTDLYDKLVKSEKEIRSFAKHLNKAIEDERSHLAREIHDEIGQQLAGIKIELSLMLKSNQSSDALQARFTKVMAEVDTLMQSLRKIATQLRPGILDSLGLISSIEWLANEFRKKTGVQCELELNGFDEVFSRDTSISFFRICQEALTNIAKHANATKVIIETYVTKKELLLVISDNGKGIESDKLSNPFSMGLLGMRERANLIGADLKITSEPGKGTTIQLKASRYEKNIDSRRSSGNS